MALKHHAGSLPRVVHSVDKYLGISETFIYSIITHHKNFKPIVLTQLKQNMELFPFENIVETSSIKKFSRYWLLNYLDYFFFKDEDYFEHRSFVVDFLKRNGIAIIHAHFAPEGIKMLSFRQKLNIPLITTFYGYDMSALPKDKKWRDRLKRLYEHGDAFLVEGSHMAQCLKELGCPQEKIHVIPIGIDVDSYPKVSNRLDRTKPIRILFCGRFVEKKGLPYALKAMGDLIKKYENIQLRVIGDGPERRNIIKLIDQYKLNNHVQLLGFKSHVEVLQELQTAHILVQPSITAQNGDSEGGAPVILLEAQAMGIPVVATRHADIPNVVLDGKTGLLVPERDASALAGALEILIKDPDRINFMSRQGREHIKQHHDIHKIMDRIEACYQRLLS